MVDAARGGGCVVALSFDPHPRSILTPGKGPERLTTFDRRIALLRSCGADVVERLDAASGLLEMSAEDFVASLVERWHPSAIVEGSDFRFGKGRAGDVAVLRGLGARHGFRAEIVDPVPATLTDLTTVEASSTMARWLLRHRRVTDAGRVLGRAYEVEGVVARGDRRGREIGFPTANIETSCMIPGDGVYAGRAMLPDGRWLPAAVHVGPRSTFDNEVRTVEAAIIGWSGPFEDGWPGSTEYGWSVRVAFDAFLRDQARFEGVEPLVGQIRRDVARTMRLVGSSVAALQERRGS